MKWLKKLLNAGYRVETIPNQNGDGRFIVRVFMKTGPKPFNIKTPFYEVDWDIESMYQAACQRLGVK